MGLRKARDHLNRPEDELTSEKISAPEQIARELGPPNNEEEKGPRMSTELFRVLMESSSIPALLLNRDGIVLAVNGEADRALGKNLDRLVGSCFYDHFSRRIVAKMRERAGEVILKGQLLDFEGEGRGGNIRHALNPLFEAEGQALRVEVFAYDRNERKIEEEASRESEKRYRQLVELSPEAIVVHTKGRFVYMNAAGAALFGALVPEELFGKKILDLIHPEDRDLVRARIRQIDLEGAKTPLQEYRVLRLDGGIADIEATGTLVSYQGQPANLVIIRDISARKHVEREMQALNERLREEQNHRERLSKRLIDLLEQDRREVAMELHDRTGQMLTTLKLDLEIISSELKSAEAPLQDRIGLAIMKTSQAINDLKKIATGLMPSMIENLGLIPSFRALLNDLKLLCIDWTGRKNWPSIASPRKPSTISSSTPRPGRCSSTSLEKTNVYF
jgi:PAS domain S-box-containing protein